MPRPRASASLLGIDRLGRLRPTRAASTLAIDGADAVGVLSIESAGLTAGIEGPADPDVFEKILASVVGKISATS